MKQAVKKSRLGIRLQEGNRLTMPVLLNQLENSSLPAQLDMDVIQNEPQLQEFISDPRPGLLLYSFMTPHLPAVYREIEGIRRYKNGNLKLVAGGSHTSGDPLSRLQMGFNLAVTGAAEMGLVCLAEAFIRNTLPEIPTILHLPELDRLDRSSAGSTGRAQRRAASHGQHLVCLPRWRGPGHRFCHSLHPANTHDLHADIRLQRGLSRDIRGRGPGYQS